MAMPGITFHLSLFEGVGDEKRSRTAMLWLMQAMVQVNQGWLKSHPEAPQLYKTKVLYMPEPIGVENWQDIPSILRIGFGDCEDLACYRIAELKNAGVPAEPWIKWVGHRHHALVLHPNGLVEDPSLALGMKGAITRTPMFVEK